MNNTALKKWIVLLSLLLVTFILVWQAPEPEQTDVVEATKPVERQAVSRQSAWSAMSDINKLSLKPRQSAGQTVDLFAVPVKPKPIVKPVIKKPVEVKPEKRVELPFYYLGMLESEQSTTLFMMENTTLYLVQEGDTVNQDFRLQHIDSANNELVWLYLPSNETRKMSMDR